MAMTLKPKHNHTNASVQNREDRKKHIKFGQMWRFCSLCSSIAMAWCIMNSWHKVVWSIRNTTLKLYADCAKQFDGNAQNYGKTNHGFCTMITQQLKHRCLCMSFCPPLTFSSEDTEERKAFYYVWEDKRKIETGAIGNTRSTFQKCFEDWKQRCHKYIIS